MKRIRAILLALAALCGLTSATWHVQSRRVRAELEAERLRLLADTQRTQAQAADMIRQVEAERKRSLAAETRLKTVASASRTGASAASAAITRTAAAPAAPDPERRRLRVQTFVGEQRMQFTALLQRLGFTPAQRQTFDRIQEEFYHAMLDEKLDAAGRQQAREARDAALREVFGASHEAWLEANRAAPARAIVDQILHQTFASSGALNAAQADELTRMVAQHRLPPGKTGGPAAYDWDRIVADARTILADRQLEGFISAVTFRRASDQMSAMVAQAKR